MMPGPKRTSSSKSDPDTSPIRSIHMFCPKCGEENPDDARFCGTCGAALPGSPVPSAAASGPPIRSSQAPSTPGDQTVPAGLKFGIAAATVFIPLIGIVMGILYVVGDSPAKKAAGRLWLGVAGVMFLIYCVLAALGGL
jgi:hypothetical protein